MFTYISSILPFMNPFIKSHELKLIEVREERKMVDSSNISEGIIMSYETVTKTYLAEKQSKVSVYEIPYVENILFNEIRSGGRDLLLYIMYNLKDDYDFINLKFDKVCKEMRISRPTLSSAIQQLKDVAIICRKSQSEYWINPTYIFKGNRIAYYQKYCPDCISVVAKVNK